jgi:flagellar P-ring protein FlgI
MLKRLLTIAALIIAAASAPAQVRIKDIAGMQGVRSNQLVGYGIVVGLEGSGDSNSTFFTAQSVVNALQKIGINVPPGLVKVKNVAAVLVTADLPAFVKNGARIDVTVSSIGDARSLQGGLLIQTPLKGADGDVYAVAQGSLTIGGFNVQAGGSKSQKNHVNVGRIPGGALVENEVPASFTDGSSLSITLKEADFTTANRIAEAINTKLGETRAQAMDPYTIRVTIPEASRSNPIAFYAQIEELPVVPDTRARIVVNERTGTVVIGGNVRVSPCAIAHGNIQVKVENTPIVVPAAPFTNSKPIVVPQKDVKVKEQSAQLAAVPATTTVDDLVKALNKLGVTPRDLIAILQLMRKAGHIAADVDVE